MPTPTPSPARPHAPLGTACTVEENHDVFISYAHIDNAALAADEQGWVSELAGILGRQLAMLLGRDVRIWRDNNLHRSGDLDRSIDEALRRSTVLVSVVTPRYAVSPSCRAELEAFVAYHLGAVERGVNGISRTFKVLKRELPLDQHPAQLRRQLGHLFYERDDRQRSHVYSYASALYRDRYLQVLGDLAHEVAETLRAVGSGASSPQERGTWRASVGAVARGRAGNPPTDRRGTATSEWGPTTRSSMPSAAAADAPSASGTTEDRPGVYLAPCGSDVRRASDQLRRELQDRGYSVFPNEPIGYELHEILNATRRALEQSQVSVHLVGNKSGFVPEGAQHSIVELLDQYCAEFAREHAMPRIVWLPQDLPLGSEACAALIDDQYTDLLRGTVETLKEYVTDLLSRQAAATSHAEAPLSDTPYLYLMHTPGDSDAVKPLLTELWARKLEVRTPIADPNVSASELREDHEENLQICDGFLVYYGSCNERWVRKALNDLRRAAGLGREKPILFRAVGLADPDSDIKRMFRSVEAEVLARDVACWPDLVEGKLRGGVQTRTSR